MASFSMRCGVERLLLAASALLFASSQITSAQEMEKLPPAIPFSGYHTSLQAHQLVGGFWRVDHTFASVLAIKNVVETSAIEVTPVLVLANGAKYSLPSITLQPAGVATVDINKAVLNLGLSSAANNPTFGTVNLRYAWHWNGAILAEVQNTDSDRSLIYSSGLHVEVQESAMQSQTIDGLWWRRTAQTGGFLRLTNVAKEPLTIEANFFGDDPSEPIAKTQTLSPGQTSVLDLKDFFDRISGSPQRAACASAFADPSTDLSPMEDWKMKTLAFQRT